MIKKERKKYLEDRADKVLFNNDMYKIPVNLLKIAQNNDIKVYEVNFEKLRNST